MSEQFCRWRPQRSSLRRPSCFNPRMQALGEWCTSWSRNSPHQQMRLVNVDCYFAVLCSLWIFESVFVFHLLQVIIVTSSLMKDMNSKTDMYRANAIRVLCRIIDSTLLTQIERYLKQAIVDKNPVVASAALVSGIYLLQVCAKRLVFAFMQLQITARPKSLPVFCLYGFILSRQVQKLWKGGAMKFRRLYSRELLLFNFTPLLFFTRWDSCLVFTSK